MRTSDNGGKDHFHEQAVNGDEMGLTEKQAREQLLWELRNQLGIITFETIKNDEVRGDGVVIAKINGEEADHYIYHDE